MHDRDFFRALILASMAGGNPPPTAMGWARQAYELEALWWEQILEDETVETEADGEGS